MVAKFFCIYVHSWLFVGNIYGTRKFNSPSRKATRPRTSPRPPAAADRFPSRTSAARTSSSIFIPKTTRPAAPRKPARSGTNRRLQAKGRRRARGEHRPGEGRVLTPSTGRAPLLEVLGVGRVGYEDNIVGREASDTCPRGRGIPRAWSAGELNCLCSSTAEVANRKFAANRCHCILRPRLPRFQFTRTRGFWSGRAGGVRALPGGPDVKQAGPSPPESRISSWRREIPAGRAHHTRRSGPTAIFRGARVTGRPPAAWWRRRW